MYTYVKDTTDHTLTFTGGTTQRLAFLDEKATKSGTVRRFIDKTANDALGFKKASQVIVSATLPKPASGTPGGFTQGRTKLILSVPMTLSNGKETSATVRIETAFDVEMTPSERLALIRSAMSLTDAWHSMTDSGGFRDVLVNNIMG